MTVRRTVSASGVTTLLLDAPRTRNALAPGSVAALTEAIGGSSGPIVLGSAEPGIFSSGADLTLEDGERAALSDSLYALYQLMREIDQVVVAAVDGPAIGGGAQLVLASDIRIAGPEASFRFLGARHGLVVGAWGLGSAVGRGRALDLILSMRTVPAEEAMAWGLVDRVEADPLAAALALAEEIALVDPRIVAGAKQITLRSDPGEALGAERAFNAGWSGAVGRGGP